MKDYKGILIVILAGMLICANIVFLNKIASLRKDAQVLSALLDKERELERILFKQNSRLIGLISPQQREMLQTKKPKRIKGPQEKVKQPCKSGKIIQGNRGFLIKDSKPTN